MVLRVDVVEAALRARYGVDPVQLPAQRRVIALDPGGRLLDDALVDELAAQPALTLLSGRYEGFDERIVEHFASDRVSIGRYVLAGGELAAMVVCDAVLRKLPGALGDERSALEESFSAALEGGPEYPHYTRPAEYRGWQVPEVLLSGHHARIAEWRLAQSRARARARTPEAPGLSPAPTSPLRGTRYHRPPHGRRRACARGLMACTGRRRAHSAAPTSVPREHSHRQPGAIAAPPRSGVRRR